MANQLNCQQPKAEKTICTENADEVLQPDLAGHLRPDCPRWSEKPQTTVSNRLFRYGGPVARRWPRDLLCIG